MSFLVSTIFTLVIAYIHMASRLPHLLIENMSYSKTLKLPILEESPMNPQMASFGSSFQGLPSWIIDLNSNGWKQDKY